MDTPALLTIIATALAGLLAGGWVVAVIGWQPQYPPGTLRPARRCPACGNTPRRADFIPVAGWLALRGRCLERHGRDGSGTLGSVPPVAACLGAGLATAVVLALLAARLGVSPALPAFCVLGVVGVPLAAIDLACRRLPDALTLPAYPVALALLAAAAPAVPDGGAHLLGALAGLAAAWLVFAAQALIYPAGIGWGDVKLAGLTGAYLGWIGLHALVAGLIAAYLLAAVTGLALLAARRLTRKSALAFGPFLLAGALLIISISGVLPGLRGPFL
jgi:leader peptidase (prepilin peptidase)/N-methyltransferase